MNPEPSTPKSAGILCTACGQEALVRREPVFEGFRKVGERFVCTACGHAYADAAQVPYKHRPRPRVFGAEDAVAKVEVFRPDEKGRNCRYCRHYVVNPFAQRCGLHNRWVQATDTCGDFEAKPPPPPAPGEPGPA